MAHEIIITRIFDAPRDLVWKVWTEAQHIEKWFGPETFDTRVDELDFKVDGKSKYVMIGPDGKEYPSVGVFKEIVEMEKIVTTDDFGEEFREENKDLPDIMLVTITFEDFENNKTKVTITTDHPTEEDKEKHEKMGVVEGWNSSLDKMERHLTSLK